MPSASALVTTDRPERYLKQLVSHFGAKINTELHHDRGSLTFDFGTCALQAQPDGLALQATAESAEDLERLTDAVTRHLIRFGTKDELIVDWSGSYGPFGPSCAQTAEIRPNRGRLVRCARKRRRYWPNRGPSLSSKRTGSGVQIAPNGFEMLLYRTGLIGAPRRSAASRS